MEKQIKERRAMSNVMKTYDILSIAGIVNILTPIFASYKVKKAVLFGSYVEGSPNPRSDVDILVDSRLKGLSFIELLEDLQTALQKNIDLFDVNHIEKGSLIDMEIQNNGIVIYEA
jgi:predicted nucleotidyltransferase